MMLNRNSEAAFLVGWLIGGVFGATLALLLAPQSGEETRAQIRDKTVELKDRTNESLAEVGQRAQDQLTEWQKKGQEVVEKGQHNVAEVISQGKQRLVEVMPNSLPISE